MEAPEALSLPMTPSPTSSSPISPTIPSFSVFLDSKEEAAGSSLTKEQSAKLNEMILQIKESPDYKELTLPSEEILVRFLMARKFDVERATALLLKYLTRFDLKEKPTLATLLPLVKAQKIILPPCRDKNGAQLIIFNARHHDTTSFFSYLDLMQYLVDIALNSRITQQKGITFLVNMIGASWKQFDAKLLSKFLLHVQDHYPARLRKVLIVDSPTWVSVLTKAVKPFMKPRLASKVFFVDKKDLLQHFEKRFLPTELGGDFQFDHERWIHDRVKIESKVRTRVTLEGFLTIKGADNSWKRRWLVINQLKCLVYKSLEDVHPLKVINLERCESVVEVTLDDRPHCFQLVMMDENVILFHTESLDGYEYWFKAFKMALALDYPRRSAIQKQLEEQKRQEEAEKGLKERELRRERLLREERDRQRQLEKEKEEQDNQEKLRLEREEALKRLHSKRTNIVQEILWTEQSYVDTLKMIQEVFIKPIKESIDAGKPIVPEKSFKGMFPEILAILAVNSELLSHLEERLQNWSQNQQIGDVFLRLVDYLRVYIGLVNNYNTAIDTINKCQQESSHFKQFLEECSSKPECRMIGLSEHLLTPIQRVPRYVLLLTDLLKNTDSEHPDYNNLTKALEEVKKTAEYINEMKRKADSRLRVIFVLEEVKNIPDDLSLVAPHRLLLMEMESLELEDLRFPLQSSSESQDKYRSKNKAFRLYLFNDLLLVASLHSKKKNADLKFKFHAKIEMVLATALPGAGEFKNPFQLQVAENKLILEAPSGSLRDEFLATVLQQHPLSKLV